MIKICLLIALAIAGVAHADEASESAAAPEPYSYAYDSGTHGASEQRDASGKVTGYYTLADADGRQRRVEYYADESGFHAKVQTNEVGTKSENSADVEIQAAPPTEEQLRYVQTQQVVAAPQAKVASAKVQYVQQQQQPAYGYSGYSYYPGSAYYGTNYGYGLAAGAPTYWGTGSNAAYGGYQTITPGATYYKQTVQQPASYSYVQAAPAAAVRYQTVGAPAYRTGYQTVQQVPASVGYQTYASGPVSTSSYRTVSTAAAGVPASVSSTGNLLGSSNYVVLKK